MEGAGRADDYVAAAGVGAVARQRAHWPDQANIAWRH